MEHQTMVILGLGSNVGDRMAHLRAAVAKLSMLLTDAYTSRIYESKALLPPDAPQQWNRLFLNMAVAGQTSLSPRNLLEQVKALEQRLGRRGKEGHWAPREIDIDILMMGDHVMHDEALAIPHKELLNRDFALLPLAELLPDWRYPDVGPFHNKTAAEIVAAKKFSANKNLRDTGMVIDAYE